MLNLVAFYSFKELKMSLRSILSTSIMFVILLSNTSTYGNPASTSNKQKNILNNQGNKAPAADNAEQKEPNPILYENYQQCYASLISDVVDRPTEVFDARKATIKKYCRAISTSKYQKRFSDCFNSKINSGNSLDSIISDCVSSNDKP
jgi:hypothetical protein